MEDEPGVQLVGGRLNRTSFLEDARGGSPMLPYGHRFWGPDRTMPRSNDDEKSENDRFSPTREDGCAYDGSDEPGTRTTTPGEHIHLHFEFQGGPIDACAPLKTHLPGWHDWVVDGDATLPRQPPPPPPPPPPPQHDNGGGGPVIPVVPRPSTESVGGPVPLRYAGGIPKNARVGQKLTMRVQFTRGGVTYEAGVPVTVTAADDDFVTVRTDPPMLNIAPPGTPSVLLLPGRTHRLSKR
jgi:hypothetical protein